MAEGTTAGANDPAKIRPPTKFGGGISMKLIRATIDPVVSLRLPGPMTLRTGTVQISPKYLSARGRRGHPGCLNPRSSHRAATLHFRRAAGSILRTGRRSAHVTALR